MNLTYVSSGTGNGADPYTGLDQFGRVIDQKWVNVSGVAVDEYTYAYDPDGNVTSKANAHGSTDEYSYDGLNRLTGDNQDTVPYQTWDLDALGNMKTVTDGDGNTVSRTHDAQNRLTGLGTATLAYDADGNTTTDEAGRTLAYDAWNRLVEAKTGTTSLVRYAYDGLGRRTTVTTPTGTTATYYDTAWQAVEDDQAGHATAEYAWSPVYVDAMIARDDDPDGDGVLDRRLYPTTADTLAWRQGFQGGTYEAATPNFMLFRNRYFDIGIQQWMNQDPTGSAYIDGLNIYEYEGGDPIRFVDPAGKWKLFNEFEGYTEMDFRVCNEADATALENDLWSDLSHFGEFNTANGNNVYVDVSEDRTTATFILADFQPWLDSLKLRV